MSDVETAGFLASVALFEGRAPADLAALAGVMRRRTVPAGTTLWSQGDESRELVIIVDGWVTASVRVTGDRTVELGRSGTGEIVGLIGLLDGGGHATSVRVTEAATVLALSRLDFAALLAGRYPPALELKRRVIALLTARLREQLGYLAVSLGGEAHGRPPADAVPGFEDLEPSRPPDSRYMRRMAAFHDVDPLALWGFLTSGSYVRCTPGRTLLAEGTPSTGYYLTVNGAVEKVLVRGDRRIRVGLAGPGRAFGYESLIDGRPSPVTAITRERSLLLVVPGDLFTRLFGGEDAISRGFLDVIQHDLMGTLRETLRPYARLAASG
jgi:CRP-like cAMP-binding protein